MNNLESIAKLQDSVESAIIRMAGDEIVYHSDLDDFDSLFAPHYGRDLQENYVYLCVNDISNLIDDASIGIVFLFYTKCFLGDLETNIRSGSINGDFLSRIAKLSKRISILENCIFLPEIQSIVSAPFEAALASPSNASVSFSCMFREELEFVIYVLRRNFRMPGSHNC